MKKPLLFLGLLLTGALPAQVSFVSQWQTVNASNSSSGLQLGGVALAANPSSGDVYTVGAFYSSITLGSYNLTSSGSNDVYVARYSSTGSCLGAVKLATTGIDIPYSIAYDGTSGNIFVSWFKDDGTNGGTISQLSSTTLSTVSTLSFGLNVFPHSIGAGYGMIYIGGSYDGDAYFPASGGPIHLVPSNSASCSCFDSFVATYNPSTNLTIAALQPNFSTDANEIMGIWVRNHRVYTTGYFKGQLKWASGSTTVTASGAQDIFVATVAIHSTGTPDTYVYATDLVRAGTTETGTTIHDREVGYGIVVNASEICITGNLSNASLPTFGSTTFSSPGPGAGAFVASFAYGASNSIGALNWVKGSFDCSTFTSPIEASIGYGIALDASGNIYATGQAYNYDGLGGSCVSGIAQPGFIVKYNSSGTLLLTDEINHSGNLTSITEGRAILVNGCDVYNTGFTVSGNPGNFSAGNLSSVTTGTNTAMYLADYSRDAAIADNVTMCATCSSGFPINATLTSSGGTSYNWSPSTDLSSTSVSSPVFSLSACGSVSITYTNSMTITGCSAVLAPVTVNAGSSATGIANAGADKQVCPNVGVTIGTAGVAGLNYSWTPNTLLSGGGLIAQPTFTASTLTILPMTLTLTVTDVCGNSSTDQVTISWDPFCPRRMANPGQSVLVSQVYPNPSGGIFNLDLAPSSAETTVLFEVTDLAGRTVMKKQVSTSGGTQEIDLRAHPKGVYLLQVTREGVSEMHRLVIE